MSCWLGLLYPVTTLIYISALCLPVAEKRHRLVHFVAPALSFSSIFLGVSSTLTQHCFDVSCRLFTLLPQLYSFWSRSKSCRRQDPIDSSFCYPSFNISVLGFHVWDRINILRRWPSICSIFSRFIVFAGHSRFTTKWTRLFVTPALILLLSFQE